MGGADDDDDAAPGAGGDARLTPRTGWRNRPVGVDSTPMPSASDQLPPEPGHSHEAGLPPGLWEDLRRAFEPRYELRGLLGRGGMGVVIEAWDPVLERPLAIKILSPGDLSQDPTARERLLREARAAATLSHPNVVSVFGVGETPELRAPYILMQRVLGETLERKEQGGGTIGVAEAVRLLGEIAEALTAAHARGMVHRDLKPSNVMVEGSTGRAVVLDFGISHFTPTPGREQVKLTGTGMQVGTPLYMSPEQAAGEPATDKSDIYSLGCLMYEVLAGRPVFEGPTAMVVMASHIKDTPAPLRSFRPDVPEPLERVVVAMLAKDPAARPSADDLRRRFAPAPEHHPWREGAVEIIRRRLRAVALTGSVVAALALLEYAFLTGALPAAPPLLRSGLVGAVAVAFVLFAAASIAAYVTLRRDPIAPRLAQLIAGDWAGEAGILVDRLREYAEVTSADQARFLRALRWRGLATLSAAPVVLGLLVAMVFLPWPSVMPRGVQWLLLFLPAAAILGTSVGIEMLRGRRGWGPMLPIGLPSGEMSLGALERWSAGHGELLPIGDSKGSRLRAGITLLTLCFAALGVLALLGLQSFALKARESIVNPDLDLAAGMLRSFDPIFALAPLPRRPLPADSGRVVWGTLQAPRHVLDPVRVRRYVGGLGSDSLLRTMDALGVRPRRRLEAGEILIAAGYQGFTAGQRAAIQRVIDHPDRAELRAAARSRRSEAWDVILSARGMADLPATSLDVPSFELTRLASQRHLLAAALEVDRGRVDTAVAMLWELVRFGRLQAEGARGALEVYGAVRTTQLGIGGLRVIYARRGQVDRLLSVIREPGDLTGSRARGGSDLGATLRRVVSDTTMPRGVRWEALQTIRLRSCAEPRMLLGGEDPAYAAASAEARATLVTDSADATLLGILDRSPVAAADTPINGVEGSDRLLIPVATLAELLGRDALAGCINLYLGGAWGR